MGLARVAGENGRLQQFNYSYRNKYRHQRGFAFRTCPGIVVRDELILDRDCRSWVERKWHQNSLLPQLSHRGNSYQLHPKAGTRGNKSVSKYPSGKPSWNDLQQQFIQMGPGSISNPTFFCEGLLWWHPDRSKARGYKCVTRTDLNPSHIHVSLCSWEFPGKQNRTFQLSIGYIGPFKKGGNLEHCQKLYINEKKINTSICIFSTQQRFPSWHPGTDLGLLQHSCLQMWFF